MIQVHPDIHVIHVYFMIPYLYQVTLAKSSCMHSKLACFLRCWPWSTETESACHQWWGCSLRLRTLLKLLQQQSPEQVWQLSSIDGNLGWYNWYIVCFVDHVIECILRWPFKNNLGNCGNFVVTSQVIVCSTGCSFGVEENIIRAKIGSENDIFGHIFWALIRRVNRGVLRSTRPGMGTILQVMGGEVHPCQPSAGCYLVLNAALGNLKTPHHRSTENRTGVTKFTHSIWSQVQKDYLWNKLLNYVGY